MPLPENIRFLFPTTEIRRRTSLQYLSKDEFNSGMFLPTYINYRQFKDCLNARNLKIKIDDKLNPIIELKTEAENQ